MTAIKCWICSANASGETVVSCPRCGRYALDEKMRRTLVERQGGLELTLTEQRLLMLNCRELTDREQLPTFASPDDMRKLIAGKRLPHPAELSDRLVTLIADRSDYGESTSKDGTLAAWAARLGLNPLGLQRLTKELTALVTCSSGGASGTVRLRLTLAGWQRAAELQRTHGPGNQAFVAMWFDDGLNAAYLEGIAPALVQCGYGPYRVDQKAHPNRIDDEIVRQLRRSRLAVVDFTGARNSVYYEAGFAHALGIPVIFTCHESWQGPELTYGHNDETHPAPTRRAWFDLRAFDTMQYVTLGWETPIDLRSKLVSHIGALGLSLAHP